MKYKAILAGFGILQTLRMLRDAPDSEESPIASGGWVGGGGEVNIQMSSGASTDLI